MITTLPILPTPRLRLRPMQEADAAQVVAWRNAPHITRVSRTPRSTPFSKAEHLAWFRKTREQRIDYMLELNASHQAIGSFSVIIEPDADYGRCGILGRYIGETEQQGQGYATEAARAWLAFVFETLDVPVVRAQMRSDNHANIAINRKLGFRTLADKDITGDIEWINMELSRETWRKAQPPS